MASPREQADRGSRPRALLSGPIPQALQRRARYASPPWPDRIHHDYVSQGHGWYPRWFPHWDPSWRAYWHQLYASFGGDARPAYAEYARDATVRQQMQQLQQLQQQTVSGYAPHGGGYHPAAQRHPHYQHGDYVTHEGTWYPQWFPYSDPAWRKYWRQLYAYYGGDEHREQAEHSRDAFLRTYASQLGLSVQTTWGGAR